MAWVVLIAFAALLLLFLLKLGAPPAKPAHKLAGTRGEERVRRVLQSFGPPVTAVLWSGDMRHAGRRFEVDALALVEGVGVVVAEVKNYSGVIHCSAGDRWTQENQRGRRAHRNASLQVLRTAECVRDLLRKTSWWSQAKVPVIPVVVFAHDDLRIEADDGDDEPQTDLVQIGRMDVWLSAMQAQSPAPHFRPTEADARELLDCLRRYERG